MVVFARQNLYGDPPFSRMDLISCRNLLIYVGPSLQKRAIPTFHYALKPGGSLFLGLSESVAGFTDLFEPVDQKYKIYSRKAAPTPAFHMTSNRVRGEWASTGRKPSALAVGQPQRTDGFSGDEPSAEREADRITVNQFAPPGVLVNADLQVLQFRGSTGAFLEPPVGKASFDLLKMAREGLMLPLRTALDDAKNENKTMRRENVRIKHDGETRAVHLVIIPLKKLSEMCFLVLFQDAEQAGRATLPEPSARRPASKEEEAGRITELETDLAETREYLRSGEEQHERANVAPAVTPDAQSPRRERDRVSIAAARRLPMEEARRLRHDRPSKALTQAECEAAICDGTIRFQDRYLGWRSEQLHVYFVKDLLLIRIRGALTRAERQLGKSSFPETGRDLIKQTRKQLLELARPMLESLVHEATGVKVLSMHSDISTATGEELVLFSLAEAPRFQ